MTETNATHGHDVVRLQSTTAGRIGDYLESKAVRLSFGDVADDEPWALAGFILSYQVLHELAA